MWRPTGCFRFRLLTHTYTHPRLPIMSMFGRGTSAPSGAVNAERMEMAIQECVFILFTFPALLIQIAQVGYGHRHF